MTADEYLTILAEVDADFANILRTHHMAEVQHAVCVYKGNLCMVLTCILGRALRRQGDQHPLLDPEYSAIDSEMDARLEWFK